MIIFWYARALNLKKIRYDLVSFNDMVMNIVQYCNQSVPDRERLAI